MPEAKKTARSSKARKGAKTSARKKRTSRRSPQEQRRARQARRRFLFSLLVLLIVGALVFFLVLRNSNEISIAENGVGSLFSRVQLGFSNAVGSVKRFTQRWHDYGRLEEDYEALALENQRMSLQLQSAQESLNELDRLKDMLNARSRYDALDPIYAKVIARAPGQWFETFSINRGQSDGVTAGMAVVNGDGLIGRVYEAGLNYAKVICIIDSRSAVACMVQNTRDNGIMRGEISSGALRAECYVYYLPNLNSVVPGDSVITSGTDSLYPKGLHIGTVTAVSMDAGSEGSYAVVTPSVDFKHIEEVFVLREVIELDTDANLPAVSTARPGTVTPTPNPNVTPTPSPTPSDAAWTYPSASASIERVEPLPEDDWSRN